MHKITIKKVLNGYIVKVGCQTVVFHSKKKLVKELARYLDDPDTVEKEYTKTDKGITINGLPYITPNFIFGTPPFDTTGTPNTAPTWSDNTTSGGPPPSVTTTTGGVKWANGEPYTGREGGA